jgi:hypothetical protein
MRKWGIWLMKYGEKKDILTERLTVRLSKNLLSRLHVLLGEEIIKRRKRVSLNDYILEVLERDAGFRPKKGEK